MSAAEVINNVTDSNKKAKFDNIIKTQAKTSPSSGNGCVKFSSPEASPTSSHSYLQVGGRATSNHHHAASSRAQHRRTQSETSAASNDASILSSHTSSTAESGLGPTPPDGGYGWVVVFAAFMTNMIADGITYSFGVMFVDFLTYFGESKSKTAWIGSLFMGIPLLAGPIASALTDRYGCRKVTIVGALLASLGFILSSFSNSIEVLYFTFGIMSGFGLALCYVAAIVIVAYYFDKRRSFATGLAVCGSGIGTFVFAPFTQFLLDTYTWRGATLILAGLFLNIVVFGALMRDLEWTKKKYRSEKSLKTSSDSISQSIPEEGKKLLQASGAFGSIRTASPLTFYGAEDPKELGSERLSNSLVQLPTFIKNGESLPPDVLQLLNSSCGVNYEFLLEHYPHLLIRSLSDQMNIIQTDDLMMLQQHNEDGVKNITASDNQISAQPLKDFNLGPSFGSPWMKRQTLPNRRLSTAYFQNLRFHRHSITHRGAMLNIHRYHLRASSCPDIYRNSMITIDQEEDDAICNFMADLKEVLMDMLDVSYFKNIKFLVFCISNLLLYIWYDVPYIYIADYAIRSGIHEDKASYLISVIGILNTIGEILLGYIGDKSWVNTTLLYAAFTSVCGIANGLVPLVNDFTSLSIVAGTFGFAISANYSLTSIIIVDLITLEKFTNAYGLLLLVQGIANLLGPPLAGWICDETNSYDLSFYMAGLWIFISGIMMVILPCFRMCRRWSDKSTDDCSAFEDVEGESTAARVITLKLREKPFGTGKIKETGV